MTALNLLLRQSIALTTTQVCLHSMIFFECLKQLIWHISVQGINKMNSDAFHFMECGSKFHPQRPEFVNTLVDQSRAKTVKCPTSWSSSHHGGSLHSYLFIAYKQQLVGIRIRVGRGGGVLLINTSDSPRCPGKCVPQSTPAVG